MGVDNIFIRHNEPIFDKSSQELEAIARIKQLRSEGLGIKKVTDQVNAEGYRTRLGNLWYQSTVERVIKGYVRDTQRRRRAAAPKATIVPKKGLLTS